ncbi:MAG TPA: UDP-4-amino-4,6-dideoxy-N-acetyl-beta-L-altrosamine transaminase, partial [Bacteroidales bacterium]|nr:UDP-4-amino-4,6-dideoxy-N-acetyl-beta-L-altrosamine transaminase [Bacteroidales bacterium]
MEKTDFIPYGRQYIDEDDLTAVRSVLESDFLTQGPSIEAFESKICEITGARYCVAVSNATAGLHIAVAALGLKPGEEGITTPITFVASSNCLAYNRLIPRFADINDHTYCIDPQKIEENITNKTKVIIPVDFAGQAADMKKIKDIADHYGLKIIEDAAHAIGSTYPEGIPVGSCTYSDMTVFSFHPVKTITTGEGGAITTNDHDLFTKLRLLRSHGITRESNQMTENPGPWYYEMQDLGFNYRLTDIQAALGISQLNKLSFFKRRRREIVNKYNTHFSSVLNLKIPFEAPGHDSCFHLYVLQMEFEKINRTRKDVMYELRELGIGTQVHYIPITHQPYYMTTFGTKKGTFVAAEHYYERTISLPLHPGLTDGQVDRVIQNITRICTK